MGTLASQITSLAIVYSTVYSGTDQRILQSSASLAFVRGIHRGPVNSPHKWPVTRKMFPFDDVIMYYLILLSPISRTFGCMLAPFNAILVSPRVEYIWAWWSKIYINANTILVLTKPYLIHYNEVNKSRKSRCRCVDVALNWGIFYNDYCSQMFSFSIAMYI